MKASRSIVATARVAACARKRRVLIVHCRGYDAGYKLIPRELCSPETIARAKLAGLTIATRRNVGAFVLSGEHSDRDEADDYAAFKDCNTISYRRLASLARQRP